MEETVREREPKGDSETQGVQELANSLAESIVKESLDQGSGEKQDGEEGRPGEGNDWPIPCSSGCYSHNAQSTACPIPVMTDPGGGGQICWTPDSLQEARDTCRPESLHLHQSLSRLATQTDPELSPGALRRGSSQPQVNTLGAAEGEGGRKGGFLRHFTTARGKSAERQQGEHGASSESSGKKVTGVRALLSRSHLSSLFRRQSGEAGEGSRQHRLWRIPGLGKGKGAPPPPGQRALPPVPPRGLNQTCTHSQSEGEEVGSDPADQTEELSASPLIPSVPPTDPLDNNLDFASSIERVKDHGWYWGPLSGEAAERILTPEPDGSFIVRDSSDHHYIFSLTFKLNGFVRHVRIEHDQGNFSFGSFTKFKSTTIVEFIENAVEHSRSGRYLFFLHRRPVLGPMRVQLLHPVSRFKRVQSLKHLCRYIIVKHVRKDHLNQLPVPKIIKTYLNTPFYYSEQVTEDSDTEDQSFARNWGVSQILNPPEEELAGETASLEASAVFDMSLGPHENGDLEPHRHEESESDQARINSEQLIPNVPGEQQEGSVLNATRPGSDVFIGLGSSQSESRTETGSE